MTEPTLRVLSLGAGVQSTTLALLACEGALPKPDAAIFADTGWEPQEVYDNLDRLEVELTKAGIPLYRVGRGGSIRDDVLDPHVFATLPAYTLIERQVSEPLTWHVCDCPLGDLVRAGATPMALTVASAHKGGSAGYLRELAEPEPEEDEDIEGVGDTVEEEGELLRGVADIMDSIGLEYVPAGHAACEHGRVITSWHTYTVRDRGTIKRQCTGKYKVEPVERKIRELLGAPVREIPCRFCEATGQRVAPWDVEAAIGSCSVCRGTRVRRMVGSPPKGATVEQWIGFSTDEIGRVSTKGFPPHAIPRFPLIELDMSRQACEEFLRQRGWKVAKSACIGCPFHRNEYWRTMRDERPEQWADAVAFDRAFRTAPGLNAQRFLHESCLPLDEAPIGRLTRRETAGLQINMLDLIVVGGKDEGPGCSPYGCRSGESVDGGA